MYKIPAKLFRTEETLNRSRFISTTAHASNEEDVKIFISAIRNKFSDASHNCWAYVAGSPGDTLDLRARAKISSHFRRRFIPTGGVAKTTE